MDHTMTYQVTENESKDWKEERKRIHFVQGRLARGGHELSKVSPGPAMPDPSMPYEQATPETALWPFQGWPARRAGGLRPSSRALEQEEEYFQVLYFHFSKVIAKT
jgi:hypothetical protein